MILFRKNYEPSTSRQDRGNLGDRGQRILKDAAGHRGGDHAEYREGVADKERRKPRLCR